MRERVPFLTPEVALRTFAPPGWRVARVTENERSNIAIYVAHVTNDAALRLRFSVRWSGTRPSLTSPVDEVSIDKLHHLSSDAAHNVARSAFSNTRLHCYTASSDSSHVARRSIRHRYCTWAAFAHLCVPTFLAWTNLCHIAPVNAKLFLDPPGIAEWLASQIRLRDDIIANHVLHSIKLLPVLVRIGGVDWRRDKVHGFRHNSIAFCFSLGHLERK